MRFTIAQLGLSDPDSHRLRTFLGMASSSGGLKHDWAMGDPTAADVIVVGAGDQESLAIAAAGKGNGDRITVAVLAGESDEVPSDCVKLPWPIRLENVLSLLRLVEGRGRKTSRVAAAPASSPGSDNHIIRLASMLRENGSGAAGAVWRVDGLTKERLYVSLSENAFYFNDSVAALRNLDIQARLDFVPVPMEDVGVVRGRKPLVMLRWLVGVQSGPLGLFPWVETRKPMQLRRYPDFQMLYHLPEHRRIATILSRPRASVEVVSELSGQALATVVGFVNASSLCGYLTNVEGLGQRGSPTSLAKQALFKSFRKALGMITADA